MKLTIDFDVREFYDEEETTLRDSVKDAIVSRSVQAMTGNIKFGNEIKAKINLEIDSFLTENLANFMEMKIQLTDRYGNPAGEPQSVNELIKDRFIYYMGEPVDENGNVLDACGKGNTRITTIIQKEVEDKVGKYTGRIVDAVNLEITKVLNDALASGIKKKLLGLVDLKEFAQRVSSNGASG